jgi:hypothetical protein
MEILTLKAIRPRDVVVDIDMSFEDLKNIVGYLSKAESDLTGFSDVDQSEIKKTINGFFMDAIEIVRMIENGGNGNGAGR